MERGESDWCVARKVTMLAWNYQFLSPLTTLLFLFKAVSNGPYSAAGLPQARVALHGQHHAPVACKGILRFCWISRLILAHGYGLQSTRFDALAGQERQHRLRPPAAQRIVVVVGSTLIGVTFENDHRIGIRP